jgi:hypothetical protein
MGGVEGTMAARGPVKAIGPRTAAVFAREVSDVRPPVTALATFAAGCFWSVELAFQRVPGVLKSRVG